MLSPKDSGVLIDCMHTQKAKTLALHALYIECTIACYVVPVRALHTQSRIVRAILTLSNQSIKPRFRERTAIERRYSDVRCDREYLE